MLPANRLLRRAAFAALLAAPFAARAQFHVTGPAFYGDAPDATHPWSIHDRNRPQPKRVEPGTPSLPGQPGKPPSDAIVLFDGTEASLAKWEADTKPGEPAQPTKWIVKDGALECVPKSGYIRTKEHFADCQLHVEWAAPKNVQGNSQGRGNSGIFLMGLAEVQVLDSYDNPTYADGSAGSIYGINPPMAHPLHPPGEYQSVDIVFRRPVHRDGRLVDPGYITVFINGVLVQDHTPLEGPGGHLRRSKPVVFPAAGPLKLQDHGNPVRFRNIWYRPLPPRPVEGGTDGGLLTPEAALAKRRETAASIRADSAKFSPGSVGHLLRLAESLPYEKDAAAWTQVEKLALAYASEVKGLSSSAAEARKAEIVNVTKALQYLAKFEVAPKDFAPIGVLEGVARAQGWDQPAKKKK